MFSFFCAILLCVFGLSTPKQDMVCQTYDLSANADGRCTSQTVFIRGKQGDIGDTGLDGAPGINATANISADDPRMISYVQERVCLAMATRRGWFSFGGDHAYKITVNASNWAQSKNACRSLDDMNADLASDLIRNETSRREIIIGLNVTEYLRINSPPITDIVWLGNGNDVSCDVVSHDTAMTRNTTCDGKLFGLCEKNCLIP